MKEKKNKKTLYLVLGITLLSVLALGGVYAYFAARVTTNEGAITGKTLDINGSTLSIAATRVDLNPTPEPVSDDLVPANFGVEPSAITTTEVNRALDSKCIGGGYTGCHVWKITATSTTDIPSANIRLNLRLVNVQDQNEWSYVVYTGTDNSSSTVLNKGNIITTFPNTNTTIDIHNGAELTANTPEIYYVMIYLNNINSAQNDGETTGTTNEKGTYNGTVTLEAMGGQVKVDFIDRTTPAEFFTYEITQSATYTVTDQSACESYLQNKLSYSEENAITLCGGGKVGRRPFITLEDLIIGEYVLPTDYGVAGLSNVIIDGNVTIINYKESAVTAYTVTDQSACESYLMQNWSETSENATTLCSGGSVEGYTLSEAIAYGDIPSSDYSAAGLNVVITPASTEVVIPSTIEGYPVTTIGDSAFNNKGLTSVEIPSSVTTIGGSAFENNQLVSVEIPSSVTSIGNNAFDNAFNTSEEVTLKIDMTNISGLIFNSKGITNLVLGEHVTAIGERAFEGNPLTSITIGNNSVTIGNCAFGVNPPLSEPFLSSYIPCK